MENKQPTFLDLLLEAHIGLERQGPGSEKAMKQALDFLGPLDKFKKIADLGCGSGGQTLQLAEHLSGEIIGLDLFPDFANKLTENAKARGLGDRVRGVAGNMESLPFEKSSFDMIWSEGAIDNIGFEKGLRHWRDFLKENGYVVVSCPTWITKEHPEIVEKFWSESGSNLETIDKNIEILQNAGYRYIASFLLPDECWFDSYFNPREKAIEKLSEKYSDSQTMKQYAEMNRHEVDLFRNYSRHYGYVFYIGQKVQA